MGRLVCEEHRLDAPTESTRIAVLRTWGGGLRTMCRSEKESSTHGPGYCAGTGAPLLLLVTRAVSVKLILPAL